VGNTTVGYQLFLVDLSLCGQRRINNAHLTKSADPRRQIVAPFWKLIKIITLQSVCSLFLLHPCLLYTSGSTPFYMSLRQPLMLRHQRNFDRKCLKKPTPQKQLTTGFNRYSTLLQIVCGSSPAIQQKLSWKYCLTSYQSIKYLQISCAYFSRTTSSQSNQQKYGQKSAFIKYIETKQIQPCKCPKLKTFQSLLLCIESLTMFILSIPTTLYC